MEESEGRGEGKAVIGMGRPGEGQRDGKSVLCPMYVCYGDFEIRCRPHVPDSAATILKYANKNLCERQRTTYCEGCWERCEQYLAWKHFRWEDED